jgi:uncharacterized membrane protein
MGWYAVWLFLHVLAVAVWVGGMFLMHFAVRPVAVAQLPPPQRQPLLVGILRRFFNWVALAVLLTLVTGVAMILQLGAIGGDGAAFSAGMRMVHPSVHLMFAIGAVMMVIYAHIRFVPFARLQRAVAAQDWAGGGRQLDQIRLLVLINLVLGVVTIGVATLGRAVF